MSPVILVSLLVGVPLVLAVFLRVKPLYLFVSIVTGYFWAKFLGETTELTIRSTVHVSNPEVVAQVGLLLIPVFLTYLIMRKTIPTAALPFQLFLFVADSLLLATFLIPLLTAGTQGAIYETYAGSLLRQAHDVIIAGVAGLHLLVMLVMKPKTHGKRKHKRH